MYIPKLLQNLFRPRVPRNKNVTRNKAVMGIFVSSHPDTRQSKAISNNWNTFHSFCFYTKIYVFIFVFSFIPTTIILINKIIFNLHVISYSYSGTWNITNAGFFDNSSSKLWSVSSTTCDEGFDGFSNPYTANTTNVIPNPNNVIVLMLSLIKLNYKASKIAEYLRSFNTTMIILKIKCYIFWVENNTLTF